MNKLQKLLKHYITLIYANEEEFLKEFFPDLRNMEVHECYFASERVRIAIGIINEGQQISTTLPTTNVIEWVDKLND